jgi:predicted ArsR family transcriptional regulator
MTRHDVLKALRRRRRPMTSVELGEALQTSRQNARLHLLALERDKLVKRVGAAWRAA